MIKKTAVAKKRNAGKTNSVKAKDTAKKSRSGTIVALVRSILEEDPGISTQDMINHVRDVFPSSKFNGSHVSYYKNKLRADGMDIPVQPRGRKPDSDNDDSKEDAPPAPKKPIKKKKKVAR